MSALRPERATAFEALVDDYDAARPDYPQVLYDALPPLPGARLLELGTGTGLASRGLLAAGADVVGSDVGPRMLGRARAQLGLPAVVARAEALPLRDACVDGVCGAQMWHWVDVEAATAEVVRVLRPGGWLAVWWNDVDAGDEPWYRAQQDRLEAADPSYSRAYRDRAYPDELRATGRFRDVRTWEGTWSRTLDWPRYERWLRSKSYVAALPDEQAFLDAERQSLASAFPDGRIVEPFRVRLVLASLP